MPGGLPAPGLVGLWEDLEWVRLGGEGARMLRGKRPITAGIPIKP